MDHYIEPEEEFDTRIEPEVKPNKQPRQEVTSALPKSHYVDALTLSNALRNAVMQEYAKRNPENPMEAYIGESISNVLENLAFLITKNTNNAVYWDRIADTASSVSFELTK